MQDPQDASNPREPEPSFSDPADPRWSQNPYVAPAGQQPAHPGNPYADQPLYAPPGSAQNPYPGQGQQPPYPGHGPGTPMQHQQQFPPASHHGYPQPPYPPAAMEKSNVFGIISMVAGVIGLITFGSMLLPQIAAIVCGHVSLRKEKPRRGFAVAGLVMGYVSLGVGLLAFLGLLALSAAGSMY